MPPDSCSTAPGAAHGISLSTPSLKVPRRRSICRVRGVSLPVAVAGKPFPHRWPSGQFAAVNGRPLGRHCGARDLVRQPLRPSELIRFDAVVLDPPRAGAGPQVEQLAAAGVPLVVYVSCNPATFARDARVLADAEYVIGPVQPFDQFLWSFHIELAAVLGAAKLTNCVWPARSWRGDLAVLGLTTALPKEAMPDWATPIAVSDRLKPI